MAQFRKFFAQPATINGAALFAVPAAPRRSFADWLNRLFEHAGGEYRGF